MGLLKPLLESYQAQRQPDEHFGNFLVRRNLLDTPVEFVRLT